MKEKIAGFNISISEILDVPDRDGHPFITKAKFILADDKPNANGQAIRVEEFPGIIASAIGMPVKMNFNGVGVANHGGSVPIGHIQEIQHVQAENGTNQLVATAMLWNDEYPEEVDFLKTSFAEGKAPGISYEMGYKDSDTIDGVQWLKKVITLAATFVKDPAYGSRTHLLALASLDDKERNEEIIALADKIKLDSEPIIITDKGGNLMEEELAQARAEAASKQAEIEALMTQLEEANANTASLQSELDSIKAAAIIDGRVRQYADAGFALEADAEKADKKKTFFASLNDEQWEEYLAELVAVKGAIPAAPVTTPSPAELKLAEASINNAIPRLELDESQTNLKDAMRAIARPYSI